MNFLQTVYTMHLVPLIWYSIQFNNELAPVMFKLDHLMCNIIVMAIPVSNACVEWIFSVMGGEYQVPVESLRR